METQKYWWQHPLADDIHQILREKEAQLPVYLTQSPQLSQRRYLVDWLAVVWEKYDLCHTARQLAVSLLDLFMDRFDIIDKQLHLVALGSLLIASKCKLQCEMGHIELSNNNNNILDMCQYFLLVR